MEEKTDVMSTESVTVPDVGERSMSFGYLREHLTKNQRLGITKALASDLQVGSSSP